MKIINNDKEFEDFYPYANKKQIEVYPKEYPCIAKWEMEGGGLMGDYRQVYIAYYPKCLTSDEAFFKGLNYSWQTLK